MFCQLKISLLLKNSAIYLTHSILSLTALISIVIIHYDYFYYIFDPINAAL